MKQEILQMRAEIAKLEKEQKLLKPQRKTDNFTGERTISSWEAASEVRKNKRNLRYLYAAYGLLRGKKFEEIESMAKPIDRDFFYEKTGNWVGEEYVGKHPLTAYITSIDECLRKYGYAMPRIEGTTPFGKKFSKIDIGNYEKIIRFDR